MKSERLCSVYVIIIACTLYLYVPSMRCTISYLLMYPVINNITHQVMTIKLRRTSYYVTRKALSTLSSNAYVRVGILLCISYAVPTTADCR